MVNIILYRIKIWNSRNGYCRIRILRIKSLKGHRIAEAFFFICDPGTVETYKFWIFNYTGNFIKVSIHFICHMADMFAVIAFTYIACCAVIT